MGSNRAREDKEIPETGLPGGGAHPKGRPVPCPRSMPEGAAEARRSKAAPVLRDRGVQRRRTRPSTAAFGADYPLAALDHGAGAVNPSTIATAELLKRFRISATSWYSGEW